LCGIAQAIVLLAGFFRRAGPPDWPAIRTVTIVALVLVYVSFAFSVKGPSSHTFYVTLPVVMIYSFYCWERLLQRRWVRVLTACLLAAGLVTHVAIAIDKFGERSLYANRPLVARAIKERNYRLLGERRPEMWKTESEGR
jgi:O-antigen ligase